MKFKLLLVLVLFISIAASAQIKKHRIIFDMAKTDTAYQATLMKQLANTLTASPDAELEVVCYGPALFMLVKGKNSVEEEMKALKAKGNVQFVACANSMKRYNVSKEELVSLASIVPVAILELSTKQMEGWSYIKAGF